MEKLFKKKATKAATATTAAALAGLAVASTAAAQQEVADTRDYRDLSELEGVQSFEIMPDGSVTVTLKDGSLVEVPAEFVLVNGSSVSVDVAFLESAFGEGLIFGLSGLQVAGIAATGAVGLGILLDDDGDSNSAPVFTSPNSASFTENETGSVYVAQATDANSADTVSYTITGGADANLFRINENTGELSFISPPDFELPGDSNQNNEYVIQITASDGRASTIQTVTITVANENDNAPTITSASTGVISENATQTDVSVAAADADGDTLSYAISGGDDASFFSIDTATGQLALIAALDFESAAPDQNGDGVFEIEVTVSDGANSTIQTLSLTLQDVNDLPEFTSSNTATVSENETAIGYTASASDQDADPVTFSIVGGADASLFSIDSQTGSLSFGAPQNFESPNDSDANNTYEVQIEASDGQGGTAIQTVQVTVTDIDEAPVFSENGYSVSLAENSSAAISVSAIDPEGSGVTYALNGGPDSALFAVDPATGAVSFVTPPDFEAPTDAGGDNVYQVVISSTDTTGNQNSELVSITITNSNDNAPVFTSGTSVSASENDTSVIYTATTADADGGPISYSLGTSGDSNAFTIDSTTGEVSLISGVDFEAGANTLTFEVIADDGATQISQTVTLSVVDENDNAPVFSSGTTATVQENDTSVLYTAAASDIDSVGGPVTFALGTGGDSALFQIDSVTGDVSLAAGRDFESGVNALTFDVVASDGANQTIQTVTVSVTDVNDTAPIFTSSSTASVNENSTAAFYTATATDADTIGGPVTFSLGTSGDSALFQIDSTTGAVSLLASRDFETGPNALSLEVIASDGFNQTSETIAVSVNNLNDNSPVFTSATNVSVDEGVAAGLAIYATTATDADGSTLTYSIVGGADAAAFILSFTGGGLSFISSPDFEAPADFDGNNVYEVEIQVRDGSFSLSRLVSISVNDLLNESSPVMTSPVSAFFAENSLASPLTATATDLDPGNGGFTFSIAGGADASIFSIDPSTGILSVAAQQDFENPGDDDGDGVYQVTIQAEDQPAAGQSRTTTQDLSLLLTDTNDSAPVFTSAASTTVAENDTSVFYTATTNDVDTVGSPITYSLGTSGDSALFQIDSTTGEVSLIAGQDFEAGSNALTLEIIADDGANQTSQTVAVSVTDENDSAPVFTSANVANVTENNTSVFYTATASDADTVGGPVTYSLGTGGDSALFQIDSATGDVNLITPRDFEAGQNTLTFEVIASDGVAQTAQTVTVSVADANDNGPEFVAASASVALDENLTNTGYIPTLGADVDVSANNPSPTYSISGGADASLFSINSSTGELSFVNARDFETPEDTDTDNIYDVEIQVSDGVNAVETQTVSVSINDVDPETFNLSALDGTNGFVILAETANEGIGGGAPGSTFNDISRLGDVDGDGFDDFAFGSVTWNNVNPFDGYVAIVSGSGGVSAPSRGSFDGSHIVLTDNQADSFGAEVRSLGDVTGDGIEDFLVGRVTGGPDTFFVWTAGEPPAPGSYDVATLFDPANGNGFVLALNNVSPNNLSNVIEVSGIGDVNGDGIDDFFVGNGLQISPGPTPTSTVEGVGGGYLVLGSTSLPISTGGTFDLFDVAANGIEFNLGLPVNSSSGPAFLNITQDRIGSRVTDLGDVNGDGFDDFVLLGLENSGSSFIVFGDPAGFTGVVDLVDRVLAGDAIFINDGSLATINFNDGFDYTALGDFNGDGIDDFAISDPANNRVAIVYGESNLSSVLSTANNQGDFSDLIKAVDGITIQLAGQSEFGISMDAGDFDGDGFYDLIIGNPNDDTTATNAGQFVVVYGSDTYGSTNDGFGNTLSNADLGPTGTIRAIFGNGENANDQLGTQVANLGDFNGDGVDDFAVGAPSANGLGGVVNGGQLFVVYGDPASGTPVNIADNTSASGSYIGSAGNDLVQLVVGDAYVSLGAGDDTLLLGDAQTNTYRVDGGGGTDALLASEAAFGIAVSVDYDLTAVGNTINIQNVERLSIDQGANVTIDISTVVSLLGEAVSGTRTLVVDYAGNTSNPSSVFGSLIIDDAPDWTANGTTSLGNTLYNVFTHTNGSQIFAEAEPALRVEDTNGVSLKNTGQGQQKVAPDGFLSDGLLDLSDESFDADLIDNAILPGLVPLLQGQENGVFSFAMVPPSPEAADGKTSPVSDFTSSIAENPSVSVMDQELAFIESIDALI